LAAQRQAHLMHWSARKSPIKKEPYYIERDEAKRRAFDEEIDKLPLDTDIIYIDECGIDKHMSREYGRSPAGERVYIPSSGRRFKRINVVAGLLNNQVLCPTKYTWNMTSDWFQEWFEWFLCPLVRAGSVIVMDNASFHKKTVLSKIAFSYGCRIIWLPPYSPDKNPIEKTWANLKNWLRLHSHKFPTIQGAISAYFQSD
jgi:transposase